LKQLIWHPYLQGNSADDLRSLSFQRSADEQSPEFVDTSTDQTTSTSRGAKSTGTDSRHQ
jgi:hypothetical protein